MAEPRLLLGIQPDLHDAGPDHDDLSRLFTRVVRALSDGDSMITRPIAMLSAETPLRSSSLSSRPVVELGRQGET